jgi:hypothetical protein
MSIKTVMEKFSQMDRRWIFLSMALIVAGALVVNIKMPLSVSPDVRRAYDLIDSLPAGTPVLFSWDYDPGSMPELYPLSDAMLRHAMRKNLKVVMMGHWVTGTPLIERQIAEVIRQDFPDRKYGVDYVNLGYKSGQFVVVVTMAQNISDAFPQDYYHNKTDTLPLMQKVKSLKDVAAIVCFSAGDPGLLMWIQYAWQRFRVPVTGGCTAVSAPEFSTYLQSKQLHGLMGGMRGAAEYEMLINRPSRAAAGMSAQSLGHFLIIGFIIIGNIAYFATRKKKEEK